MSDHSARPRIESVGTFVLTVEEPPAPECPVYDEFIAEPSWTVIGEGSDGEVVLTEDAPAIEEEGGDTYTIFLVVMGLDWSGSMLTPWMSDEVWDGQTGGPYIDDDATEPVPGYLQIEAGDCFSDTWQARKFVHTQSLTDTEDSTTDDLPHEGEFQEWGMYIARKKMNRPMPAGTTIQYDVGNSSGMGAGRPGTSIAKVVLAKNVAPYSISPHGSDEFGDIDDFFGMGGIAFLASWDTNCRGNTCGIFTGVYCDGMTTVCDGESLLSAITPVNVTWWSPDGDDGGPSGMDCDQYDISGNYNLNISVMNMDPGGLNVGSTTRGDCAGYAWPWQEFY